MTGRLVGPPDSVLEAAAEAQSVADLARLLRRLRRREARRRHDSQLTYRELAVKTGWSLAAVGEYFRGRTLPPTDRFDVLTTLLGATPAEQGVLATARDRAEEYRRQHPGPARTRGGPGPVHPAEPPLDRPAPDLAAPSPEPATQPVVEATVTPAVPQQLPADVTGFTGRRGPLATLDGWLAAAGRTSAVVVGAVSGTAGVGKTALAVHWAHRTAHLFPDGQLYVDLRGFDPGGQVMAPTEAVRGFLDALGVPTDELPPTLDAQLGRYRSLLAGRRILIVLDNAADADQVRPLLPGSPTAFVLITSRNRLAGLVATAGAHPLVLDLLTDAEARELLAHRLSAERVAAEAAAVDEIIARCARLPLALTVAAASSATSPGLPLVALAAELSDAGTRLDTLSGGDSATEVRAVFSWSYTALDSNAARLFRLLGLPTGPDISVRAAASLAGLPAYQVRPALAELTRASLLTQPSPGRYACHDLLREYAADLVAGDVEEERRAAVGRLLDHYVHTALAADRQLNPYRDRFDTTSPAPGVTLEPPADPQQAMAWFVVEHVALLGAVGLAARWAFDGHAWELAWALQTYLYRQGRWPDLVEAGRISVQAADRLGDPARHAQAYRSLAAAHTQLGQHAEARAALGRALERCAVAGDAVGQGHTHYALAYLSERRAERRSALDHARQALASYRAAGHVQGQAGALNACGWSHVQLGEYRQALDCCTQALALHRELGDREGQAHTWDSLGYAHHHLGDHGQATACYRQALELFRDLGDRINEAEVLTHLGDAWQAAGDLTAAGAARRDAERIRADLRQ